MFFSCSLWKATTGSSTSSPFALGRRKTRIFCLNHAHNSVNTSQQQQLALQVKEAILSSPGCCPYPHMLLPSCCWDTVAVSSPVLTSRYGKRRGRTVVFHWEPCLLVSSPQGRRWQRVIPKGEYALRSAHSSPVFITGLRACVSCPHIQLQSVHSLCMPIWRHNTSILLGSKGWSHRCVPTSVCHAEVGLPPTLHFLWTSHAVLLEKLAAEKCAFVSTLQEILWAFINGRNVMNDNDLLLLFSYIALANLHTAETGHKNSDVFSHIVKIIFLLISYQWYLHRASKGKGFSRCQFVLQNLCH